MLKSLRKYFILFIALIFSSTLTSQIFFDGIDRGNLYTVAAGSTEVYSTGYFDKKDSYLTVDGTLIIQGDLNLAKKDSWLKMGRKGILIVYGNLNISNTVDLELQNLVIVHGNIIGSSGGGNSGVIKITDTGFYNFGTVSNVPLNSCGATYTSTSTETNTCHYGDETSYINNYENGFSDEEKDLLSCYSLLDPTDKEICLGSNTIFTTTNDPDLTYTWQVRSALNTDFSDISGATAFQYAIETTTTAMDLNEYRVIARTTTAGTCKIAISEPATLDVVIEAKWTGNTDADWNKTSNWFCGELPVLTKDVLIPADATNFPILSTGSSGFANNIEVEDGASIEVQNNDLELAGNLNVTDRSLNLISGKLIFSGSTTQYLGSELISNTIEDIELNNSSGLILNDSIAVTGSVLLTNGDLTANSNLNLISSSLQTALIDGSGTGNIIGLVSMQRYIDPAFGYKYFSSPFSDTMVGDFSAMVDFASAFPHFYRYNEDREDSNGNDATGWEAYTDPTSSLDLMRGYVANLGNETVAKNVTLTGTINNGSYSKNLMNNNGTYTKGFHLVGNPYPSPIDWNASSGWTRTNMDAAAYFFSADNTDQYTGSYTSYVNDISSSGTTSSVIPSMQGFFVHVKDGTTGTFGMNNNVRINDYDQEFFKTPEIQKSLIRISAKFSDQEKEDHMVVYMENFSSKDFDGSKDALKLFNTSDDLPNIYGIAGDKELSINAIPDSQLMSKEWLPLGMELKRNGKLTISIKDFEGLDSSIRVFLIDTKTNSFTDLIKEIFEFNASTGRIDSRFYLSFTQPDLPEFDDKNHLFDVISKERDILVKTNVSDNEKAYFQLWSIDGKLLEQKISTGSSEIAFTNIKAKGIYLVSYNSGNKREVQKVIVK
ncbi:T9SS type A sorting domain-containing protein [Christiangramia sp. SM2212]|uniref:T9SS type A sorting domain-containing protein n=1 Tax=Christiangramia sediminicola TaxID=3073267 RepID=A0ABU1EQG1_9FLAO|nr:T9SS type A sorting domain-containing protein [Christiangramia sp. SM2212]MDR5590214.1 T9SS type A sorting domain-containing protein [Christiangramia sp. SM2212]